MIVPLLLRMIHEERSQSRMIKNSHPPQNGAKQRNSGAVLDHRKLVEFEEVETEVRPEVGLQRWQYRETTTAAFCKCPAARMAMIEVERRAAGAASARCA